MTDTMTLPAPSSSPAGTYAPAIMPLQSAALIEPIVSPEEHAAFLTEIKAAVYDNVMPAFKTPVAFIEFALKTTSDLEIAKARAAAHWARSEAIKLYTALYTDAIEAHVFPIPQVLIKAIEPSFWEKATPTAHRITWALYGALIVLGIELAWGLHGL